MEATLKPKNHQTSSTHMSLCLGTVRGSQSTQRNWHGQGVERANGTHKKAPDTNGTQIQGLLSKNLPFP